MMCKKTAAALVALTLGCADAQTISVYSCVRVRGCGDVLRRERQLTRLAYAPLSRLWALHPRIVHASSPKPSAQQQMWLEFLRRQVPPHDDVHRQLGAYDGRLHAGASRLPASHAHAHPSPAPGHHPSSTHSQVIVQNTPDTNTGASTPVSSWATVTGDAAGSYTVTYWTANNCVAPAQSLKNSPLSLSSTSPAISDCSGKGSDTTPYKTVTYIMAGGADTKSTPATPSVTPTKGGAPPSKAPNGAAAMGAALTAAAAVVLATAYAAAQ